MAKLADPIADLKKKAPGADLLAAALANYEAGYAREQENIEEGYTDLSFVTGEGQWDEQALAAREGRPCLTVNRLPQFCRQITGDIRQMRPGIKVVPVDNKADPDTAKVIAGMTRYIENRSRAQAVYFQGADQAVQCGRGAWRVTTEYAAETTFDQEIRIAPIEDGLSVIWDPDANQPGRTDAMFCFVMVDMSRAAFTRRWPGASAPTSWGDSSRTMFQGWYSEDYIRVAEYWFKEPVERTLLVGEGKIVDLTDKPELVDNAQELVRLAMVRGQKLRVEKREGFVVKRAMLSAMDVLDEPVTWPGRYIPIVTMDGEEVRIGRKVVRHGAVRFARDPQRMYNYYVSAQTETVALQPKAPFLATDVNVEENEADWENSNNENRAVLIYKPDGRNGGIAPQRQQPPVSSQGISEGLAIAANDIQATTGIYNASLGASSNETSGRAITARQREGDTGTYVYIEHFHQAVQSTAVIVVDLIPRIYDTTRIVRIIGEDGDEELVEINKPVGLAVGPETAEPLEGMPFDEADPLAFDPLQASEDEETAELERENDVTVGAYDVVVEMGPAFNTLREEARDGMLAMIQAAPQFLPLVADLFAQAQDWPMADEFRERLETTLSPEIKAKLAEKRGEPIEPPKPNPAEQAAIAQMEREAKEAAAKHALDMAKIELDREKLLVEREKLKVEMAKVQAGVATAEANAVAAAAPRPANDAAPAAEPTADPRVDEVVAEVVDLGQNVQALDAIIGEVVKRLAAAGVLQIPGMSPEPANEAPGIEPEPAPAPDLTALGGPETAPLAA